MSSKSYAIGAKNGLLEQKHLEALGQAIWLYLWFLDKQPKDTDKVLGGKPITYQMFAENFPGVPRQTYIRWLSAIKAGGYIDLLRTPVGYVITINKPKKWFDSDVSKMRHHKPSDVSKMGSDVSKSEHLMPKNDTSNIKETINIQRETVATKATMSPEHAEISKLFYEAIKALKLPVANHITIKAKIKALAKEDDYQKIINYLKFIRDQYETVDWSYKPAINTALDIYTKRLSIRNTFVKEIKDQTKSQSRVLKI